MLAPLRYPAARRSSALTRMHGVEVADPYDWLADAERPEVREWLGQQARLTGECLGQFERRTAFRDYICLLPEASAARLPARRGHREFQQRAGARGSFRLIEQSAGAERLLLDTLRFAALEGYVLNPDFVFLSPTARYVVLGCTKPGEDWAQLFLIDLDSGESLEGDWLPSAHLEVSWAADESGFYYNLTRSRFGHAERTDGVYWHALAQGRTPDRLVFELPAGAAHCALPLVAADGERLYVKLLNFVTQDAALIVLAPWSDAGARELLPFAAPLNIVGEIGDRVFVETRLGAPNGRIVSLHSSGSAPDLRDVVREQPEALELSQHTVAARFSALVGKRLVATYVQDAAHEVRAFDLDGTSAGPVPIPGLFTVVELAARETQAMLAITSFATPCATFRIDPATLAVTPAADAGAFSLCNLEVSRQFTSSADGTRIPFFVIRREGTHGPQPTLLYGYGGWGSSLTPSFRSDLAAWVDAGGTYAVANTRGGGEYGERWHEAGARLNRHKTFEDFSACAQALIERNFAAARSIVARGASNGGLLVTAVLMRQPDLFAAIVAEVPLVDVVHLMSLPAGAAIAEEIGNPIADAQTFRYLLDYSPLQNVRPHPKRAALMLIPGGRDSRTPPGAAFKLTAAMQATALPGQTVLLRLVPDGGHVGWPRETTCEALADGLAFLWHHATETETAACPS